MQVPTPTASQGTTSGCVTLLANTDTVPQAHANALHTEPQTLLLETQDMEAAHLQTRMTATRDCAASAVATGIALIRHAGDARI